MSDFSDRLGRLTAEQRGHFLRQMRGDTTATPASALRRRDSGLRTPPSFQQEQMWFVDRLGGGRTRNTVALRITLDGPLQTDAMARAVTLVVRRHDVLHSRLVEVDGRPVQERLPGYVPEVACIDLTTEEDPQAALQRAAEERAAAPFDLAAGPPVRIELYRVGAEQHVLLWVVHHIAWDPQSTSVLMEELTSAYEAFATGRQPQLPALPVRYADAAAWQRERLTDDQAARAAAFWKSTLGGVPATEILPDRPRSPDTTGTGRGLHIQLPAAVLERVRVLAGEHDTTVFVVLLAAFNVLLSRWARADDVLVGTAAVRRRHVDLHGVIGCFVEMVALRTPLTGCGTFRELLDGTRQATLDAFAHADLPFEQVVEAVKPPRDALRHPVFQIEFTSLGAWGDAGREAAGVRFLVEQLHDGAAKFDLSVLVGEVEDRLEVSLEYNTSLYQESTVQALLDAFALVVRQVTEDPDVGVDGLRLLDAHEEARLTGPLSLGAPGDTAVRSATLVELFLAQAERTPDAVAVRRGEVRLAFRLLDAWSDRIAQHCVDLGVARGDGVALRLTRGPSAVAAILGVLKAGAFYVPIDPAAPPSWARAVVEDAGVRVLITDGLPRPHDAGLAVLSVEDGPPDSDVRTPPGVAPPTATDLAYVLYTSGSSGTPKGVMVEHGSVAHFATAIADAYDIDGGDTLLQYAPLTFDVSVFEVFTALVTGAELVVADDAARLDPDLLMPLLQDAEVTVAELPPALLPLLRPDDLPGLRLVSVGGEAFPGQLVADWTRDGRRFVNGYGPTETTVAVTLMDCVGAWDRNPPIGRPMAGHQALVLDEGLRPVPLGAPGELCIGGPGVARGYLHRPDLTGERFVANPYAGSHGADRLYRTGDLVRWLPDGNLEFLGRTDRQVKVRGFRIEPGEVEAVLCAHPAARQAVVGVVVVGEHKTLVAHVVGAEGRIPDAEELRRHAADRLPAYMVPVIEVLEAFPLTSSGKIDRAALPPPGAAGRAPEAVVAPRDEIETCLVEEIVGPVLERTVLDVEADFFAAGGSSLQATTVVSRVRARFDVEIVLADFFRAPTVACLAELIRAARREMAEQEARLLAIVEQVEQMTEEDAAQLLRSLEADDAVGAA